MPSALAALIEVIIATLKKGDKLALVGLGTFEVRKGAARTGHVNDTTRLLEYRTTAANCASFLGIMAAPL
jgi:DNA-binding protein HU-beta